MTVEKQCPKCAGRMTDGFIIDKGDYGSVGVSAWQEGAPRRSIWTGIKLSESDTFQVTTWRCGRCGLLESYAPSA